MRKTVLIPKSNVPAFEKEMEKLIKLSEKLNSEKIECNFIEEHMKEEKYGVGSKLIKYIPYHKYEISGSAPTLNDYTLVAILEKQIELNLVYHVNKEIELPENLDTRGDYCEHCNSNRRRKHLYILQEANTKEFIQVGKTCVKDFTGYHKNPEQVARWFEIISSLDELEKFDSSTGYLSAYFPSIDIIAHSSYLTDKEGYIKRVNETLENPATSTKTIKYLLNGKIKDKVESEGYYEVASKVIGWVESQDSNNDYMMNLKTLIKEGIVEERKSGYLASAYVSYLNSKQFLKSDPKKVTNDEIKTDSQYVGTIKERRDFELTLNRTHTFNTMYGEMKIYSLLDKNGNVFIWKTGNELGIYNEETGLYKTAEENDRVKIKGTIKEHSEFNGVKQTVLTRCKVLEVA